MKKIIYSFTLITAFLIYSCEENFTPKGNFNEQFVLNCIISADSTKHIAVLMKTYDVEGFDPSQNTQDLFEREAVVRLRWKKTWFTLKDTIIQNVGNTNGGNDIYAYYLSGPRPESFDSVEIHVVTKDGYELSSRTRIPSVVSFTKSPSSILEDESFSISWFPHINGVWYLPRLKIIYTRNDENNQIEHFVETPTIIYSVNGQPNKFYPGFSAIRALNFDSEALDSTLLSIAGNEPKSMFRIVRAEFELLIFDQYLSNYISVSNGYFDVLSVRTDEVNYTNINGGLGIFGTYKRMEQRLIISTDYLRALGYNQ